MIEPNCTKEMLYQWYVVEKRSYRFIFKMLNFNNSRTLKTLLFRFEIPVRHGSEAIKTQWLGNSKRRKDVAKKARVSFSPYWGQELSDDARKKISESKKGKKNPMYGKRGPLHHHFLGGKKTWDKGRKIVTDKKKQIISQLGSKCIRCGSLSNLTINHKIPWRIVRHHEAWNLEILCKKCHFSGPNKDR